MSENRESSVDLSRLEAAVNYAKVLQLTVLSSAALPRQSIVTITAQGLEGSGRQALDGHTYFGNCKRVKHTGEIVNDFIIPTGDSGKYRGQQFDIFYDIHSDGYFIRDLGAGFGTFLKVSHELRLRDNHLLNMGDNFILVNLQGELNKLRLKVYGLKGSIDVFYFNAKEYDSSYVSLGRVPQCDIQLTGSLASKVQACISHTESRGWVLVDGDAVSNKNSTNGTWLYLSDRHELTTGMVFKSNHSVFEVNVI